MEEETQLFPGVPCFVDGDPEASGFYELQSPDGFRRVKSEANCRCRVVEGAAVADPCLLVRALATHRNESPYLSVAVAGQPIGVQPIFSYGTYFFRLPSALLKNLSAGGSLAVRLSTLGAPVESTPRDSRETALAIYEVRLIDLNTDDFPERHEFLEQIKIFQPAGGTVAEILHGHTFRPADRLLEIGCGQGWTTVLLAGFSSARVWGVDLYDYSHPGRRSFKAELQERFDRHRPALLRVARFEPLADREILGQVLVPKSCSCRTTLLTSFSR